jgi:hypothetical protein
LGPPIFCLRDIRDFFEVALEWYCCYDF